MILLDSHVVIWLALTPEKLSPQSAAAVGRAASAGEPLGISVISLYETANAIRRGRIQTVLPEQAFLDRLKSRFKVFPVSSEIAICAAQLPDPFHGDPMDRMIAATAIVEECTLITADHKIREAALCKTIW